MSAQTTETVAIACDHAGVELKRALLADLTERGVKVLDLGTDGQESVDYPDYGYAMGEAIAAGQAEKGILICGTGIGIAIAANRHKGIRAAVCHSGLAAKLSREHNDANVLALGARLIGIEVATDCVEQFLNTTFAGGRHQRRVDKLSL